MPSETIYGSSGDVNVRVSWGNDESGTVQVATLAAATGEKLSDPTDRLIRIVNDWLKEAGQPVIDLVALRKAMPYEPMFDGWHATLNGWGETNRLIKVLQRARDRAFGSPA